jgi:hypothetical protein
MNQFYAGNIEIDYPLVALPARPPAQREWFADAVFRIGLGAEVFNPGNRIALTAITDAGGGNRVFDFTVVGGPLNGWVFRSPAVLPEDLLRVRLDLLDTGLAPRPEVGYGFVVVGVAAALVVGIYDETVVDSVIRPLFTSPGIAIRLANLVCAADTTPAEVPGTPTTIQYRGWVETPIARCVEIGVYPLGEPPVGDPRPQTEVVPNPDGDTTVDVPIPPPSETAIDFTPDAITTITLTPTTIADAIPTSAWDAEIVPGGPLPAGPGIIPGYNAFVRGDVGGAVIEIDYILGRGLGVLCDPHPCTPGVVLSDTVRSVLGVYGPEIEFVAGSGVDVLVSPGDHRIYLVFKAERLIGAAP